MCLIALAWNAHPEHRLVVAANRDEWRARPTAAAHWWDDAPHLLAGRDLEAGGTWLGVTRSGRFAALTNFRDPSDKKPGAPSRGELVCAFLASQDSAAEFLAVLRPRAGQYAGFNLLVCDGRALLCYGQRDDTVLPVPAGVHALSNHTLNEPWPKVQRAKSLMGAAIGAVSLQSPRRHLSLSLLAGLLSDGAHPPDDDLPDTSVGLEWERALSPILISGEAYGTRSSTVVVFDADGPALFCEATRDATGGITSRVEESFRISD